MINACNFAQRVFIQSFTFRACFIKCYNAMTKYARFILQSIALNVLTIKKTYLNTILDRSSVLRYRALFIRPFQRTAFLVEM